LNVVNHSEKVIPTVIITTTTATTIVVPRLPHRTHPLNNPLLAGSLLKSSRFVGKVITPTTTTITDTAATVRLPLRKLPLMLNHHPAGSSLMNSMLVIYSLMNRKPTLSSRAR
jgi:hypothetical protein